MTGLDVDAVARGLAEMEQAIAERDRYKRMLHELIALAHGPADGALFNHLMHIRDTLNAEDNHG